MGKLFSRLIAIVAISAAVYLIVALGLIASQTPSAPTPDSDAGLDFAGATGADLSGLPEAESYTARDGTELRLRRYRPEEDPGRVLVLLHGSGWHGMQFHEMATRLAARGAAQVVVPDLRGHGPDPRRRGDIDHVGQLENDVADLLNRLTDDNPGAEIVLGGHSSGGGLVVRFAGGAGAPLVDRYVLLAPFLKHDAPTTRQNSGGWAHPAVRRIIGLTMLNTVGITALNHLPVIAFAMPRSVLDGPLGDTATTRYSFRLNAGYAPRADYTADIAALRQPFLLLAGAKDEAFIADRYEPLMRELTDAGAYEILPGIGHLDIARDAAAVDRIATWLEEEG